jgi:hypothetical protein
MSTGEPLRWVNASLRSDYGLFRLVDPVCGLGAAASLQVKKKNAR